MKIKKEKREILLFLLFNIIFFLGGMFLIQNPVFGIPATIIGFSYLIIDRISLSRDIRSKIDGEGISKVTVADTPPANPKEGDLWIDVGKLK